MPGRAAPRWSASSPSTCTGSTSAAACRIRPTSSCEGLQLRSIKLCRSGRAGRGDLPHHREQHAPADRADGRHRGAARRLPARARSRRRSSSTNTASRRSSARSTIILDQSEAAARALIRAMPDGIYTHETFLDNDRAGDEPLPIRIKVIVAGDEMTIDYSGIAGAGEGADQFRLVRRRPDHRARRLQISDGRGRDGERRHVPPAQARAAARQDPQRRSDRADGQLFDAVPDRDRCRDQGAGEGAAGARAGRPFRHPFRRPLLRPARRTAASSAPTTAAMAAGAPARPTTAPARSAPWRMATPASSRSSCRRPICRCGSRSSRCAQDSGGAGKFRGGLGFRKSYRMLAPCDLQTNLDRTRFPPWGVQGGKEGKPGRFTLRRRRDRRGAPDREGEGLPARGRRSRLRRDRRRRRLWPAGRARARAASNATSMPAIFRRRRPRATMV